MTYFEKNALLPLLGAAPEAGLALVVAIPCHDEPDLLRTLASLAACTLPQKPVEVIVLINSAEHAPDSVKKHNAETQIQAEAWAATHSREGLQFHVLHFPDLPPKQAGVGLARKIAMDEAARRLVAAGNPRGLIACLDADSRVERNYLEALVQFFDQHPACPAAGIYFEHPITGDEFPTEVYTAIIRYELHLRYYVHALRWAGLPTATQTIGSAMAVRADAYQAQGGMNRRQAGEDFYFLHKFTPLRGFAEITTTTVIPSPRSSQRVPFGTGKAVGDMLEGKSFLTYSPLIFNDLKLFLKNLDAWQRVGVTANQADTPPTLPRSISAFLEKENFPEKLREIQANTASPEAFRKRFFRWFDPFKAMKFVHFARDHFYPNVPVEEIWIAECGVRSAECGIRNAEYGVRSMEWMSWFANPQISTDATARDVLQLFRNSDKYRKTPML